GNGRRASVRAYASYLFGASAQDTGKLARQGVDLGLTAMKFGCGPVRQTAAADVAHVQAARRSARDYGALIDDAGLACRVPAAFAADAEAGAELAAAGGRVRDRTAGSRARD